ncbi:extracellular solute-binding protein [Caldicellulosiruptoraceae bacterium PP1]
MFEDITETAKKNNITKDLFFVYAWSEPNYTNKLYGLPTDADTRTLYWNKKLFKEAGFDSEKPPKTIVELDKMAEKLTNKKGNRFEQIGFIPWLSQGWLYTCGWVLGGEFQDKNTGKITANDPNIIKALEWEVSYAKKYNAADVQSFSTATASNIELFLTRKVAMMVSGPWMMQHIKH